MKKKIIQLIDITPQQLREMMEGAAEKVFGRLQLNPQTEVELPIGADEACKVLGISKPTLYKYTSQNIIPFHKREQKLVFFQSEIIDWLKEGKQLTVDEIKND